MSAATTFALAEEDQAAYRLAENPPAGGKSLRIHDGTGVDLAAGDTNTVVGIAVLKAGTFHGMYGQTTVTEEDLHTYVARHERLRGIFRPALRIDHSIDILSVIGRFTDLRVEDRPDATIGGTEVPMLVGDVQLVGTPEENRQYKAWMASGKLDERSSELWPYRTNTGEEFSSIFAGCAFVDIPAVEGLSPITLRRHGATLSATDTEGTPMTATTDTTPATDPVTDPEVDPAEQPVVDPATPAEDPAPADPAPVEDPTPAETPAEDPPAEDPPTGELAARRDADIEAEVERRVALRLEAEQRITSLRSRGVLTAAVGDHAETLLRHTDQTVRDAAFAVLDAQRPPVKLGAVAGTLGSVSSGAPAGDRTTEVIHLDMTRQEATDAYTALDAAGRLKFRHELAAWQAANPSGD